MEFLNTKRDYCLHALQQMELKLLEEFDRICRKYDIKYSLGGGTSLGQIRHGGFIPWDDDIDIDMTIPNFKKFMEVAPAELDPDVFYLRSRSTTPSHYRSCARLELKYTKMVLPQWRARKEEVGIFIDLFQWNYLPDNEKKRKRITSELFLIRAVQNYKAYHGFARKAEKWMIPFIFVLGRWCPQQRLVKREEKLVSCCGDEKTGWIIDDAIINGNHGGYPSEGVDEYTDVQFENLTVLNKKNPDNFMHTIYGPHCYEWLPNIKRISHHKWINVDFGPYAKDLNLPENYADYMTVNYNRDKISQMKKVSMEMIQKIHEICEREGIEYGLVGPYVNQHKLGLTEIDDYYFEPMSVAMKREDYEKFCQVMIEEKDPLYFLQTRDTDAGYNMPNARLRLNYTFVHENGVPGRIEETYNSGFFVNIAPLDRMPEDKAEFKKVRKKLESLRNKINIKATGHIGLLLKRRSFVKGWKYVFLKTTSMEKLLKKYSRISQKFNETDASRFYSEQLGVSVDCSKGMTKKAEYCGCHVRFVKKQSYISACPPVVEKMTAMASIKRHFPEYYDEITENHLRFFLKYLKKSIVTCYLNFFDHEEYQLSVLRYDEKQDKFLTNEELFQLK